MQQRISIPEGYVSTGDWARQNNKTIFEVDRLINSYRLEFIRIGPHRFVKSDATPKTIDLTGWMTLQVFADFHQISWTCAQRLAQKGQVQTRKVNGRVMVWGDVRLERHETKRANGRGRISFRVIKQEGEACQTA